MNDFAKRVKFPTLGLICKSSKVNFTDTIKGITDWEKLNLSFYKTKEKYGSAFIETDMRAMYNPTRLKVIEKATKKLIVKIKSCCPKCNTPGFGITDRKPGLPCSICGYATSCKLSSIYTCQKCNYIKVEMYPDKIVEEDPLHCDICNP